MKNCIKKISNLTIKGFALLAIALVALLGVLSTPLMNVAKVMAASIEDNISSGLKIKKMPKKATLNNVVNIPFGESDRTGETVTAKILDPKGKVIYNGTDTAEVVKGVDSYKLTPTKVGTYKVQYSIISSIGASLSTQEFNIVVTADKATMSFEENSKYIIPSVTNGNYQIVLPNPSVLDSEGNEVDNVLNNLTISIKDTYTNTTQYSYNYANENNLIKKLDNGHYAFTPNAEADCSYIITYTYVDSLSSLETTEVFEVNYEKEFDAKDIKLGYKFNGSIPESMELGKEQTLPLVNIYDENDSDLNLSAYTDVQVVFIPNNSNKSKYEDKLESNKDYVIVSNSNVFTPIYPSSEGTYRITYAISSFYSLAENKIDKTLIYSINDVKDTTAPITYAVKNYDESKVEEDDFEFQDASYKIPSKIATNTEVYFPAIFAKDNVTSYADLTLRRVIVPESGSNITLSTRYDETEGKYVDAKNSEMVSYKFTKTGTYTIRYEATDKANKYNYTGTTFTIVVEDDFSDTIAPRITLNNVPSTTKANEVVSFAPATVVDYASIEDTENEVVDKNVRVKYYYFTANLTKEELKTKYQNDDFTSLTEIKINENNKYTFTAPASADVKIVCFAEDYSKNVSVETRTISIIDVNDNDLPTMVTVDATYANSLVSSSYSQDDLITLPDFVVSDGDNSEYLEGSIKVEDKNGSAISVTGAKYTITDDKLTISNARFIATKAGNYTITYTINDIGGNYLVKSYIVNVQDTKAPTIIVEGSLTTVEVGEATKMPSFIVKDNGEVITNATTEIRFIGDNNPSYKFNKGTGEFTALEAGIFTYEYYAKDSSDNETISGPYTFEAKDTIKPVITVDKDLNSEKTYPITKDSADNILPIILPDFTASDVLNGIKDTKVIVKSPSEKELTVTKTEDGYKFTPTVDGIYTVIYSATDNANNTTEESFLIKIGDNTKPSIVFANDLNLPTEMKVNSGNLKIDLSKITVNDNGESKTASDLISEYTNNGYKMFTLTVTGPKGSAVNEIADRNYEYDLTETGKYTVTFVARDKAGNEKTIKNYVEVYAEDNKSVITSETWSIVLIVLALGVLAGVVIYFIKTRDKKPTKKDIVKLNKDSDKKGE